MTERESELREAVWADPEPDAPRMVYADYLQQQGDPLGELIALQLDRARTGARPSDRESELSQALPRHRAAEPLGPHLGLYSIERGFLAHAMPSPRMTHALAMHPAWSTVTRLELDGDAPPALLANPALRARTLAAREEQLVTLASRAQPFPFTSLVAINPHWGLTFTPDQRSVFDHRGAFDHVRLLSVSARGLEELDDVTDTRLFRQLEHLDLSFTSVRVDDLSLWLRWFESGRLPRVSFQIALGADDPMRGRMFPYRSFATHYTCLVLDRSEHVTLQISEPTEARQLAKLVQAVDELCAGRTTVEIHDLGDSNQIASRQALVLAALRDRFAEVRAVTGPVQAVVP